MAAPPPDRKHARLDGLPGRLASEVARREPLARIEGKYILIETRWHKEQNEPDGYWLEIRRIATPNQLLGLVEHLSHKVWATPEVLGDLIRCVIAYYGWRIHPF